MKRRIAGFALVLPVLAVILSACGSKAATPPPTSTATTSHVTPVPTPLIAYGSYTDPILRTSIGEAQQTLAKFRKPDYETLGDQCSLAGGDISNQQTSFHGAIAPNTTARMVFRTAENGYKLVLSSMDECGMAADSRSKGQLTTAGNDLKAGLYYLARAEYSTGHWQSGRT